MAISGLFLLLFLCIHIAGNATLYLGTTVFQRYCEQLHDQPLLIMAFRAGLLLVFSSHILTGILLFLHNQKARPTPSRKASRTIPGSFFFRILQQTLSVAASTMPHTGVLTLVFILFHVSLFWRSPHDVVLSQTVTTLLGNPLYGLPHIFFFVTLMLHIHHGIWSLFQSLGLTSPALAGLVVAMTTIIPVFFLIVAGGIPLVLIFAPPS